MCGIYGVFRFDAKPVEAATLARMGQSIAHRGPDDRGQYTDGNCGIGMTRLAIIDPAGGQQPISNHDDTNWVVCNGEIYNFRELREELIRAGYRFKTHSDTEVILHLYDALGDGFVERLEGMFDFALWDSKRRRLLIGRDQLGVKPLYLYRSAQMIAFATEAKALLTLPEVSVDIDRSVLVDYLHLGYVSAPQSLFKGITKLPPATLLEIDANGIEDRRYWRLPDAIDTQRSEQDWIAAIHEAIEQAVHKQMVSDVPIGAFLSGGVDSSAVVAFMARHSKQPIRTYAIGFEGGKAEALYNELPYARQVARQFGTEHREIVVRPDVVDLLPKLIWHMDEPIADSASITTYLVSKFAREDVKVILSGVGGDELFGGYRRYLGDHYLARLERFPAPLVRAASNVVQRLPSDRHGRLSNLSRLAREFLGSMDLTPDERYRRYVQVMSRERARQTISGLVNEGPDSLGAAFADAPSNDAVARLFAVDAASQLPGDLLMLTDKTSMAVSLECRVPLLDQKLVELAATIPASLKIKGGQPKYLMKEALKSLLPQEILHRPKRGFGTPMGAWLKGSLAGSMNSLLSRQSVERRGLLQPDAVQALVADHQASRIDGTDALLALMNLEIWCRVFLDRQSQEAVSSELLEKAA
ncbi:MAG TPA: asparagine synthase (glutamine-hydrolyzing) [Burkholderiaceae bacterium]|nr:asparagine synthase (glutamine-hydrolyzing) [Burkholderiaceae bacterium]